MLAGMTITVGAAVALILCYRLCRAFLDRHRLARWDSAWAVVGPQWTAAVKPGHTLPAVRASSPPLPWPYCA